MNQVKANIEAVNERIAKAISKAGRSQNSIKLLAVSKTKPSELIREAFEGGQKTFGENYAQEFKEKAEELKDLDIEWHFIGNLQRNKVKYIVPYVTTIHSINSVKLAEEINKRTDRIIDCFVEVNIAGEEMKTGLELAEVEELIKAINEMENLNLIGLMTMPPYDSDPEKSRPYFVHLRTMMDDLNEKGISKKRLTELSMGMTGDLEVAIEEGSTIVRVGTAIFGERDYS